MPCSVKHRVLSYYVKVRDTVFELIGNWPKMLDAAVLSQEKTIGFIVFCFFFTDLKLSSLS